MEGRIQIRIETRNGQRDCSFRCPHLRRFENGFVCECLLFGALSWVMGKSPTRHEHCLKHQVPFEVKLRAKRLVKSKAPTAWERINGRDKL